MRVDTNFYGTVPMPDAGSPDIHPKSRRYGNADYIACYENLLHWARTADGLGIDTMWLTEHHFQYEGYEVLPNLIMFGMYAAARTNDLRFGQMFNVVPQWHPLRLAEDFALADILTGGRMEFGVGRGTVPREAWSLGAVVASNDNAMSAEHNRQNREMFEEGIEVIKAAWYNETFEYRGKHFVFPPDGIPDRGTTVPDLTLIPKPRRKVDIYQACSSPDTVEYVPRAGHRAVYWLNNAEQLKAKWDRYAEIREEIGDPVAPGDDRCLVFNLHVGRTREEAVQRGEAGHTEFVKFMSQYGGFKSYRHADGTPVPNDFRPSVDDSRRERIQVVGSIDDAVDAIGFWRDLLDLKHICLFLEFPGLTREQIDEQLHLVVEEVFPRLGEPVERRPLPAFGAL